ncbi:MAG: N-acetylmuramoyl-L-alanine amidase [Alkalibacterium sp.]|nr:N-acetylmuramoyl-L-alanine amidase [Alkalibacterium sp.]
MTVHGLFTDLPQFKDVRNSIPRHATKRFPVLDINSKTEIAIHHALVRMGLAGANAAGYARFHVHTHDWPGIGYSYVIEPNGDILFCNPVNWRTYHVGNSNNFSIGICLTGDFRTEEPTDAQKRSLNRLVDRLKKEYSQIKRIRSHHEYPGYSWKGCCIFDYNTVLNAKVEKDEPKQIGNKYTVQQGDTFWSIAKGREFEVIDLQHANPNVDPTTLRIGQAINIPTKSTDKATVEEKKSPAYAGNSITRYLESIGEDSSFAARKRRSEQLGIRNYTGTADQNIELLSILRDGQKPTNNNVARLEVDGSWGQATTRRLQQVLGTQPTGLMGGQARTAITLNIPSVQFGTGGSLVVREMQKRLGLPQNQQGGLLGPLTLTALQKSMGTPQTGAISRTGSAVVKELQHRLNQNRF